MNWSNLPPSLVTSGLSIGQTAVHEFGHALGLDHDNSVLAAMMSIYPFGGDLGGEPYRIGESDYGGLKLVTNSGNSTGINLMLGRFERIWSMTDGKSREVWSDDDPLAEFGASWSGCPGETIPEATGPSPVAAHIVGSSGTITEVVWWLNPTGGCASGDEIEIGDRALTMLVGTPTIVGASGGYTIPSNTVPGTYTLCAAVDPAGAVAETSEIDNHIKSEKLFTVLSCP